MRNKAPSSHPHTYPRHAPRCIKRHNTLSSPCLLNEQCLANEELTLLLRSEYPSSRHRSIGQRGAQVNFNPPSLGSSYTISPIDPLSDRATLRCSVLSSD